MDPSYALGKVKTPAIVMMVFAGIGALFQIFGALMNILGAGMAGAGAAADPSSQQFQQLMSGAVGIVMNLVGVATSVFCLFGFLKMMKLESRTMSYAAVIVSMIPCLGSCWCINLFVGIWALMVLSEAAVRDSFTS